MIYLGNGRYLDLVLAAFVIIVTAVLLVPPFLAWKWTRR